MRENAQDLNTAVLAELLTEAFMDEKDLRRFCRDSPELRDILDLVSAGAGLQDHVDVVIRYCKAHLLFDELLAGVQRVNPGQYARFASKLPIRVSAVPAERSSEAKMLKRTIERIVDWANQNEGFLALVGVLLVLGSWLLPGLATLLLSSIAPTLATFIEQNKEIAIWIAVVPLALAFALVSANHRSRLRRIEEKINLLENLPQTLLQEKASADLSTWSFGSGQWTSDQDGLSVTKSPYGGICKIGASWENYEFTFEFKIMEYCAGWIVRANSDSHYVMIQCNNRQVRPHIRTEVQMPDGKWETHFQVIKEVDHNLALEEWNKARTEVQGHSIKVWINETLVWSDSALLKDFAMGTVGFRCSHNEHALFRQIKVERR